MYTPMSMLLAAPLLVLVPGCPLLEVQVEVEGACLSYPGIEIPGSPDAVDLSKEFRFDDLAEIHDLLANDGSLQFVSAKVTATSGVTSLDFVDRAQLTIASGDPGSALPPLDLYACDGDCAVDGASLTLTSSSQRDVLDYLRGDAIVGNITIAGQLPVAAWTMDVEVCVRGTVSHTITTP